MLLSLKTIFSSAVVLGIIIFDEVDPGVLFIFLLAVAAFFFSMSRSCLVLFIFLVLWFVSVAGFWYYFVNAVIVVLLSSFVSVLIGVALGVLIARMLAGRGIIKLILDFVQALLGFVYLI
nr:hypothetical protein [Enterococcus faecium]